MLSRGEVRAFLFPHGCHVDAVASQFTGTFKITIARALWPGLPLRQVEQRSD
jgi:hypothetical protein